MKWEDAWQGCTAVVMASGPSLTDDDIETVRQWRAQSDSRRVVVTNTTYQSALWADAVYCHDAKWFHKYRHELLAKYKGDIVTIANITSERVTKLERPKFDGFGNSGAGAAALCVYAGCRRVVLLGCDAKYIGGKRHHFGNHPHGLGNAMSFKKWPNQWKRMLGYANMKGAEIVNASRDTALTFMKLARLEDALCES